MTHTIQLIGAYLILGAIVLVCWMAWHFPGPAKPVVWWLVPALAALCSTQFLDSMDARLDLLRTCLRIFGVCCITWASVRLHRITVWFISLQDDEVTKLRTDMLKQYQGLYRADPEGE